jgi:iron complex outermembrane receptor protein
VTAGTGFAGGRGSVVGYVGYAQRDLLLQSEREFSRLPLTYYADVDYGFGPGRAFLGAGGITDYGIYPFVPPSETSQPTYEAIFAGYGYAPGTVPFVPGVSINDDGTAFMSGNGTANSVANFRGESEPGMSSDRAVGVNDAPWTALQLPLERASAFARVRYDISDSARVSGQVLYADYETTRRLGPVPGQVMLSPITNPYVPDDVALLVSTRVNPLAPFRVLRRMPELGPRYARNERDLLQGTIGLGGRFAGEWRYDAYLQAGRNRRLEHQTGNLLKSRFEELTFAPDGGQSICGLMNPFGRGQVSAACAEYMATDAQNEATVDQALAEASITGPLLKLPAGELTVVLGMLHKEDEFRFDADPAASRFLPEIPGVIEARPDLTGFPVGPDQKGRVRNTDLYVEALLPLWRDGSAARDLTLGLGYRYSEYSQTGGVDSYKGELSYRPLAPLRLRSSYQHAVRAPSVEELYSPQLSSQFALLAPDPCNFDSPQRRGSNAAQVEALCVAQGVPSVLLPSYFYSLRRVGGITGGNPQLDAEVADTLTLGFVLTSPFEHPAARGLRLSVDGYWIEIDDAIARREVDAAVQRCFDPSINPGYDPANGNCGFFTREASTGFIVASLLDRNLGRLETSGVDVQLEWSIDTRLGTFGINEYLTYVDTWRTQDTNSAPTEYAGTIGGSELGGALPKLRSLLEARFERRSVGVYARWQHVEEVRDAVVRDFMVPSRDYFGIGATYQVTRPALAGLTIGAGIDNVTDEQPPIFPTWQQANTDPSQYDVLGRRYYVDMRFSF